MGNPHVIVIPYPAQGHVIPMLELSQRLANQGIKVTFVNTDFNHDRVVSSSSSWLELRKAVSMVSIPDGLEQWEDRNEITKLSEAIERVMPRELEALITKLNTNEAPKIDCVIVDWGMAWVLEVAERLGLRRAVFCPAAAATMALTFSIPKLLSDGIINENGLALKKQIIDVSPSMPPIHTTNFIWASIGDEATQKSVFHTIANSNRSIKPTDWILCNSSHILEAPTFSSFPHLKPIGPLLSPKKESAAAGSFWPEDSGCLSWLDQHPPNSVIYVAFGSFAVFDSAQFAEIALGLELTNRPFLWVVRRENNAAVHAFPAGFEERVLRGRGRVAAWAPQKEVLSHASVACFVSHCGWNSTIEGVSNGVPFLCWPYFGDQFTNRDYICDVWKVGLGLDKDENGMITQKELKDKVELVVGDEGFKERVLKLGAGLSVESVRGGSSHSNFTSFIHWVKNIV